jgi:hypothetical protein
MDMIHIDEASLQRIEQDHEQGVTSAQILEFFAGQEIPLSEATLRKYVQLGLLPRSVRVGRKGKHQGSQGLYPVKVIRQILHIKQMMADDYTIEQIQREFYFIRRDLQQLEEAVRSVFGKLAAVLKERRRDAVAQSVTRQVSEARTLSKDLLARLAAIETRLTSRVRVERAAAS